MAFITLTLYLVFPIVLLAAWIVNDYFRDPRRLRRFPAPATAALLPFWSMWHSWKCDQYLAISDAHARLGPTIRIEPTNVSFTDPDAYKDIYGHGAPLIKSAFFDNVADGNPSMSQASNKAVHQAKRRSLAHIFSAKEITAMEPRVIACVEKLIAALKVKSGGGYLGAEDRRSVIDGVFDLRPWLNMLSYEAIANMVFTYDLGFLSRGTDETWSLDSQGQYQKVNAMDAYHSGGHFNTTFAQLPTGVWNLSRKLLWFVRGSRGGSEFFGISRALVKDRMDNEPPKPDLFARLPYKPSEKRPVPMPLEEIVAECATLLDAGNDTTQTTLTNCIYLLAKHPEKQDRLHRELAKVTADSGAEGLVANSEVLKASPYLRAVLEENWRCRPAIARGLSRRTINDETVIGGHVIFEGTTVSFPLYALLRDKRLFRRAHEFVPERWLASEPLGQDEQDAKNRKEYCTPFSVGPRACIGRNLAYMEVSIVIAALVLNFEWELPSADYEMPVVERFNCNAKELRIKATPRVP